MFKQEHNNNILKVLKAIDSRLFIECNVYFGGGTALILDHQEYRKSIDIDFICSTQNGNYKELRRYLYEQGYKILFSDLSNLEIGRGTTNQYGIRLLVETGQIQIKLEIIAENRFSITAPRAPQWSPVPCLSIEDCFASKLLANADRFQDRSTKSRDLVDLAILRNHYQIPETAINKAEAAYGIIHPLKDALKAFQMNVERREDCFESLQINRNIWYKIIDGLDLLAQDFQLDFTPRSYWEEKHLFDD